jgi:hypothetical protein
MLACKVRAYPNEHPRPAGDKRCNLFETFVGCDEKRFITLVPDHNNREQPSCRTRTILSGSFFKNKFKFGSKMFFENFIFETKNAE